MNLSSFILILFMTFFSFYLILSIYSFFSFYSLLAFYLLFAFYSLHFIHYSPFIYYSHITHYPLFIHYSPFIHYSHFHLPIIIFVTQNSYVLFFLFSLVNPPSSPPLGTRIRYITQADNQQFFFSA